MDKDKFMALLEKHYSKRLTHSDALQLIFEYCLERGKEEDICRKFIDVLPLTPYFLHCFEQALHWYKAKFNITEIMKPQGEGWIVIKIL